MKLFKSAVLVIHGFAGGLYDNEVIVNYLQLDNKYDCYAYTLPGHVTDKFKHVPYQEWLDFLDDKVVELINNGYHSIVVIGHSMGGVLACYLASKYKEIKKVVLISAAFDYINIDQNKKDLLKKEKFLESDYGNAIPKLFRTPIPMLVEFTKFVKAYHDLPCKVFQDTLVLQSECDELVPVATANYIYDNLGSENKYLTILKDTRHRALSGRRSLEFSHYIKMFLKGGRKWNKIKKEIL